MVVGARYWYFGIFAVLFASGIGVAIYRAIASDDAIIDKWYNVMVASGAMAMGSAAISLTLTETWRAIMVIARDIHKWFEDRRKKRFAEIRAEGIQEGEARGEARGIEKGRQEGRVEGKHEGRQEERGLWEEWNARRMDAEARGEDFLEPPPNGKV